MADPITLLILIAAGEGTDPTTRAVTTTTQDALGSHAHVIVREAATVPTDAAALSAERSGGADVVVELTWTDSRHQQASLRMHVARSGRWIERTIGFVRSDMVAERGRTLGFTIASILPDFSIPSPSLTGASPSLTGAPGAGSFDVSSPATATTVSPLAPTAPSASSGAVLPATATSSSVQMTPDVSARHPIEGDSSAPTVTAPDAEKPSPTPTPLKSRFAVDLLATGATGIGENATGIGGGAALEWFPLPFVSFRLGAALLGGTLDAAQSSTLTGLASIGAGIRWLPAPATVPIGLVLRADYLLVDEALTHFAAGDPTPDRRARLISGADGMLDGMWRLSRDVELFAGGGIEDVFASTYVYVHGARTATLPPLRVSLEAGLRLRF